MSDEESPEAGSVAAPLAGNAVLELPDFCLLLLVGASGSGKSTLAARLFAPTEVLSSDAFRAMVSDDPDCAAATGDAFALLRDLAARRLAWRRLTVVDATNLRAVDRATFVAAARAAHAPCLALLLDVPEAVCLERNRARPDPRPAKAVKRHCAMASRAFRSLRREGFTRVLRLAEDDIAAAAVRRVPLRTDRRADAGPFDIIGDVHGCWQELRHLLDRLGYTVSESPEPGLPRFRLSHPEGRRIILLGDLADRGPDSPAVLQFAVDAAGAGAALCVPGNHDIKLLRHLRGREQSPDHGFAATMEQLAADPERHAELLAALPRFLDGLPSHLVLDGGALAVAHAGVKKSMLARASRGVLDFCAHGEHMGDTDDFGLRVRADWAADYDGEATVVHGHTAAPEPRWTGRTLCIDTGAVFGGSLTAFRWPERELVQVPAMQVWCEPKRPLDASPEPSHGEARTDGAGTAVSGGEPASPDATDRNTMVMDPSGEARFARLPDAAHLLAKRLFATRFGRPVSIDAGRAAAAFETLARFSADPRWLVFVAPTTATVGSSAREGWLERPEEAFAHYAQAGVSRVCVQEKHMGSRAVAVICRDAETAARRFGDASRTGAITTKTGRPFFADPDVEADAVARLRAAAGRAGLWETLGGTGWVVIDGEMLPWLLKAGGLIRGTFAPAGCAGAEAACALEAAASAAAARGVPGASALAEMAARRGMDMAAYRSAYRPFAADGETRFAPFHILAAEGQCFSGEPHSWHMARAAELAAADRFVAPTAWREVDPASPQETAAAAQWWEELCDSGREGVVVKGPCLAPSGGSLAPSVKVRGRSALRIIYGPGYDDPATLPGLKCRATGRKRTLARIGLAIGLEGLARLAEGASMARVHEAVAGSLAVASEPVDARL